MLTRIKPTCSSRTIADRR